jgi:hypothetical protein
MSLCPFGSPISVADADADAEVDEPGDPRLRSHHHRAMQAAIEAAVDRNLALIDRIDAMLPKTPRSDGRKKPKTKRRGDHDAFEALAELRDILRAKPQPLGRKFDSPPPPNPSRVTTQ